MWLKSGSAAFKAIRHRVQLMYVANSGNDVGGDVSPAVADRVSLPRHVFSPIQVAHDFR